MADDAEYSKLSVPIEDDSESLSLAHATRLAKHRAPLLLSGLKELEPEIAHILVGHKGHELSLPSLLYITPEVAGILADYEGTLRLDGIALLSDAEAERLAEHKGTLELGGLYMLTSIPLAKKLAIQWRSKREGTIYPNIVVEVAEALDLWPPASDRCPGDKPDLLEALFGSSSTPANIRKPYRTMGLEYQWKRYRNQRHDLLDAALRAIRDEYTLVSDGLDVRRVENMPARLTEVENRFCITLAPTFPYKEDELFDYVDQAGNCLGPFTADTLKEIIQTLGTAWCFYWPCGDPDDSYDRSKKAPHNPIGPTLLSDVCLAVGSHSTVPFLGRTSLRLLQAWSDYLVWFFENIDCHLNESTQDFDWMCDQAESMDNIAELAFTLTPQLREIPVELNIRGRLFRCLRAFAARAEQKQSLDESQWRMLDAAMTRMQPYAIQSN